MSELTRRDLDAALADHRQRISEMIVPISQRLSDWFDMLREDIAGNSERLDVINGRIRTLEVMTGKLDTRMTTVEREAGKQPKRRDSDRPVSKAKIAMIVSAITIGVVDGLSRALPFVAQWLDMLNR